MEVGIRGWVLAGDRGSHFHGHVMISEWILIDNNVYNLRRFKFVFNTRSTESYVTT